MSVLVQKRTITKNISFYKKNGAEQKGLFGYSSLNNKMVGNLKISSRNF